MNLEAMPSPLVIKEAELFSKIEGTIATAYEVYQQQAGEDFEPAKRQMYKKFVTAGALYELQQYR